MGNFIDNDDNTWTRDPNGGYHLKLSSASANTQSFNVGGVNTIPYGATPTVTNSGTSENVILNFGIPAGKPGDGLSAYQIAVSDGYIGTEIEWLASLKGTNGSNGLSAYQLAVNVGYTGTEEEWIKSLDGTDGTDGTNGINGTDGKSAYQIAVDNGYSGTVSQWLESLKGDSGTANSVSTISLSITRS